jgi:CheY-like chemotaxis protein
MQRIIIIDDDEEFGGLTKRRLHNAGFDATFQNGPFGTLNAVRKGEFDLAIVDIAMPGLTGPDVVKLIRDTHGLRALKIILYSSMDPEPLQDIAGKLGVHGYLPKSASKGELITMIEALLGVLR